MDLWHIILLAAIQGITEFLPISSSAHLILVPHFTGLDDQGLLMDVAMHIGTLAAVMLYFHQETRSMIKGSFQLLTGNFRTDHAQLALYVIVGTLPTVIAGFFLYPYIGGEWRTPVLIGFTTIIFGLLLWFADKRKTSKAPKQFEQITLMTALFIGLWQVLALIPGVSRSGITMTAALFFGFRRDVAARFSLLLSIPTTAAAGMLAGFDLWRMGDVALQGDAVLAAFLSFLVALAAIAFLMAWLRQATFTVFVAYRLILGAIILFVFL